MKRSKKKAHQKPTAAVAAQMQAKFKQAMGFHQQGQLTQAQVLYRDILKSLPDHFDAIQLLGVIALQVRDFKQAVDRFDKAIALNPDFPEACANRGIALRELGQLEAALASFEQAIALKPDYAEAYTNRGNVLKELNRPAEAVASYDRAIALKPDYTEAYYSRGNAYKALNQLDTALASYDRAIELRPNLAEAHSNRGNVFRDMEQYEAALASYDKAIALKPGNANTWKNRGNALRELHRLDEAVSSYDKAIVLKPDDAEAHTNRGNVLKDLNRLEAAVASYDRAIELWPDSVEAHYKRGIALQSLNQPDAALASYDRAIELQPDFPEAHTNRGNVLRELNRLEAAIASYDRAIELRPDFAIAYSNRGMALRDLRQPDEALASFDQAIALDPEFALAYMNKSLVLLITGDFKQGWPLYEWRWEKDSFTSPKRNFPQPLWSGRETLAGKTILLHSEQGFGDAIQFSRYAGLVAERGAEVILEVTGPLLGLFTELAGVYRLIERGRPLPDFDYHCPLLSLPLAFKTELDTIPHPQPYLHVDADKLAHWSKRLGEKTQPRVGLVWSGNQKHKNDHNRSIPLSTLIAQLPADYQYISLQKEMRESDRPILQAATNILHVGDELDDFTDTAALCELMDVVISVDTSVAHLSGALGRPTWILLPFSPDWRWLLDRDDSPWYSSMKLYRQNNIGDWDAVLDRVSADLLMIRD